jgi:hypothetical protein
MRLKKLKVFLSCNKFRIFRKYLEMKENLKNELEEISPILLKIKQNEENLQVPNHFFNNMRIDIMAKLKDDLALQTASEVRNTFWNSVKNSFAKIMQPKLAIGFASVVLLAGLGFYFLQQKPQIVDNEDCTILACVPDQELNAYIDENINEFDEKTIWEISFPEDGKNQATIESKAPINQPNTSKKLNIKDAKNEELDEMLDEMIKNGEIEDEDIL